MPYNYDETVQVILRIRHAHYEGSRDCLAAIGSAKSLGCWQPDKAAVATYIGFSIWQVVIRLPRYQTTHWKWIVLNKDHKLVSKWESGYNRALDVDDKSLLVMTAWNCSEVVTVLEQSETEELTDPDESSIQYSIEIADKGKKYSQSLKESFSWGDKGRKNESLSWGDRDRRNESLSWGDRDKRNESFAWGDRDKKNDSNVNSNLDKDDGDDRWGSRNARLRPTRIPVRIGTKFSIGQSSLNCLSKYNNPGRSARTSRDHSHRDDASQCDVNQLKTDKPNYLKSMGYKPPEFNDISSTFASTLDNLRASVEMLQADANTRQARSATAPVPGTSKDCFSNNRFQFDAEDKSSSGKDKTFMTCLLKYGFPTLVVVGTILALCRKAYSGLDLQYNYQDTR